MSIFFVLLKFQWWWIFIGDGLGRMTIGSHSIFSYHVPFHNMLKWITRMITLYNNLLYGGNLLDFLFCLFLFHASFEIFLFSFYWKLAMVFFFFYNNHGLFFHFYLYSVREENTLHFENFGKSFFVFFLLQFCFTLPNVCKSLSSMVMCSNKEPK